MTPIVSPTTNERIIRTSLMFLLFAVFCGLFIKDGYYGYPNENLEKLVESLDPVPTELPAINEQVTHQSSKVFTENTEGDRRTRSTLVETFGEPGWENENSTEIAYFGPGGMLLVEMVGDLIASAQYEPGEHDDTELFSQKAIGFVLAPFVVVMLFQVIRVVTTRVELTEDGLKIRGAGMISFDSMKSIDWSNYRKKGYADLAYESNGRNKTSRLDDYVIRDFKPIVSEICRRCNFEYPLDQKDNATTDSPSAAEKAE